MDVIDYLNANIRYFNVDYLELMFDVQNVGDLLDAKQTYEFLQSVEDNVTLTPIVIKKEPMPRKLKVLCFVDLTESSDDTEGRIPSRIPFAAGSEVNVETGRKRKQRVKRSSGQSSAKKRTKSQKSKVTKKLEQLILVPTESK